MIFANRIESKLNLNNKTIKKMNENLIKMLILSSNEEINGLYIYIYNMKF